MRIPNKIELKQIKKVFQSNKKEKQIFKSCAKSNLVYSKNVTFYKYRNINEIPKCSFYSKQNGLTEFKDTLETF